MTRLPNSPSPEQDSASNQQVTKEWVESLPEELKDAALHKLFNAIEANLTLEEFFNVTEVIHHELLSGKFTELADSVATKTEPDQKKDIHSKKKMKPRGFSPKK